MKILNTPVKFFLFVNFLWFTTLYLDVVLLLHIIEYHKDTPSLYLVTKISLIVLIFTSIESVIDAEYNRDVFNQKCQGFFEFLFGFIGIVLSGFIVVGLIHIFIDYDSFSIASYLKSFHIGTLFILGIARGYLFFN